MPAEAGGRDSGGGSGPADSLGGFQPTAGRRKTDRLKTKERAKTESPKRHFWPEPRPLKREPKSS